MDTKPNFFSKPREFTCPKCGSHHFGTADPTFAERKKPASIEESRFDFNNHAIGHCNGYIKESDTKITQCRFNWRRKDDAKYFT